MTAKQLADEKMRDAIVKLLSDADVGRVSTVEGGSRLADGDDYIDLENLNLGVQRAGAGADGGVKNVVSRNSIHADAWDKIVRLVAGGDK